VPNDQRGGVVMRRMFFGFLFMPPLLWWAAVSLYTDHIFRRKKDENGYLLVWGRWVEVLATVMIIVNALAWWMGITYASWILGPGLAELSKRHGRGRGTSCAACAGHSWALKELFWEAGKTRIVIPCAGFGILGQG
jgi:hypothetical protein